MTRPTLRDAWDAFGASLGAFLFAVMAWIVADHAMARWFATVGVLAALVGLVLLEEAQGGRR